jgi:hypothetical protein
MRSAARPFALLLLLAAAPTASGCAVPPVIATTAAGASAGSFAATGRPLADHGISAATGRDCRLLRGLAGGELCAPTWEPAPTAAPGAPALRATALPGTFGRAAECVRTAGGTIECGGAVTGDIGGFAGTRMVVVSPR